MRRDLLPPVDELLALVEPDDLMKFGMIPEFIGRLPVLATLNDLKEDDLVTILTEPKNALVKQYKRLLDMDGVELKFTEEALAAVAKKAKLQRSGARGLRSILERAMLDVMYDIPSVDNIVEAVVNEECIRDDKPPVIVYRNEEKEAS